MDKEQAIKILERHSEYIVSGSLLEQALSMAIDALKAQLSQESTTSDLISRTETVERLRITLGATVPIADYDDGYVDGVQFAISTVSTMPPAQPEPQWIPVERELPEDRKSVIVCYRYWLQFSQKFAYAIVIGWHASKFGVKAEVFTDWDGGDFDYNEEQDENYIPEGWYEFTTQGNGDLMDWYIDAEVIAWMPLPKPFEGGTE